MPKDKKPTPEQITEVRKRFLEKMEFEPPEDAFHDKDIARIKDNDIWLSQLLQVYDLDVEKTLQRLWENCAWRKSFGVNEIDESNVNAEYLHDGQIFVRNKDKDGKPLLILSMKKHSKSQNSDELMRIIVYWIERIHRENYLEKVTIFMDMSGTGLSNVDLDFIKRIIELFETKYPSAPNYILVHDLPFLLNAAFKIVKTFLPADALEILKVTSKKDITLYVDKDNCLKLWGGNDDYEYKFA
ncbi:motile sperm domain-containing protein 2 [Scaptodrosophila lebanonensis]|uniref:Motile sperm domain-containing protein 2 n=1 Tax=Drosophila lebanonensis TaxID=7225 RepID=A0A6J2TCD9_DROLE|nr:motile sperm domain-containing protein 2 [Scaptodrosophila lebanonensis]XP_030372789.1 motile sperm domain-containing protein 2 [Scaptodrosophila lebanonensis]